MKAVHDLITELAVYENEHDAVEVSIEDLERDGFSDVPKFRVFLAEEGNNVIGMALFYERFSTWKGKAIHLEDLIVTKSQRGKGIGYALFSHFIKFSSKKGVRRIEWAVLDWNIDAINFYKSNGATVSREWQIAQMNELAIKNFINKK